MAKDRGDRPDGDRQHDSFDGFGPKTLRFFHELARNNNREWFQQNQETYEAEVRRPMAALLNSLVEEMSLRGIPLAGDPKRSMFRIHRDVRFSNDKSPYKTHAGAVLTPDGNKKTQGLLYVHVASEGSFTAAGFYRPQPEQLASLRRAIVADPERFQEVELVLKKYRLTLGRDEALKRLPRGFEEIPPGPIAEALKLKSFVVRRNLSEETISRPRLVKTIAEFAEAALPLLTFGWEAMGNEAVSRASARASEGQIPEGETATRRGRKTTGDGPKASISKRKRGPA